MLTDAEPGLRIAFTIILLVLIVIASTVPGVVRPGSSRLVRLYVKTPRELQKAMHVLLYALLTLLLTWTLQDALPDAARYAIAIVAATSFAAAMQFCQTRIPGRFGTLKDVALDGYGALIGVAAAALVV